MICSLQYLKVLLNQTMSLRANLSIILHIHNFKNLALPHKARYAIQARIYQGQSQKVQIPQGKNIALPFNILQTQFKKRNNVSRQSYIDDCYFRSKKFNIEYQDEQIDLNDCCEFKMNIEGFPSLDDSQIYLEFILVENTACYFREDMDEEVNLKEAERYKFKIQNIQGGIIQYYQGEFCKGYVSSFSFSLYLMITDYRFYPFSPQEKSESSKDRAREKVSSWMELMQWAQKYLKNWENAQEIFYKKYVKSLRYNSVLLRSEFKDLIRNGGQEIKLEIPKNKSHELVMVGDKQFFEYVTNYHPEKLTQQMIKKDIYQINQQNFDFFQSITKHITKGNIDLKILKGKYKTEKKDLFGQRLIKNLIFGKQVSTKEQTSKLASKLRKKKKITELKIVDEHLFNSKENQHYAMLQINIPHSLKTKQYQQNPMDQVLRELSDLRKSQIRDYDQRNMVVFLCHGFQASSYDMEMIRREISKMLPTALIHSSLSNENDTDTDIGIMGMRLADQVRNVIERNFQEPREAILSFVGHSMGGIIARSCLAKLPEFEKQLGFFFSLSSPHLGYLNGVDTMIKAGLWFMRKMNKVKSLDQLVMQDAESLKQTFLYKLSHSGHLRNFKKIILLSSSEDSYVPWHSARISYSQQSNSRSRLQKEMIDSIIGDNIIHRIDINFDINSTKNIDSFIGRTAHINLLTQECILKLINESVPNLFDIRQL